MIESKISSLTTDQCFRLALAEKGSSLICLTASASPSANEIGFGSVIIHPAKLIESINPGVP